jgi:hypothetical protein
MPARLSAEDPIPAGTRPFEGLVPAEIILFGLIPFDYESGCLGTVASDSAADNSGFF